MKTHLYLIRHAESEAKAKGIVQGKGLHVPLSPLGHVQAAKAASQFPHGSVSRIFTSTALRAVDTSLPFAVRFPLAPVERVESLHERSKGTLEGLPLADTKSSHPELYAGWDREADPTPPEGESFLHVEERVLPVIQSHVEAHIGSHLLYITHGNVIRVLLGHVMGADYGKRGRMEIDYCSLSHIFFDHDKVRWGVSCINQNLL